MIRDIKRVIRAHHDHTFHLFVVAEKTEEAREEWKQRLIKKIGYEEAEKLIQATEESKCPNKKWSEAQEAIKQNYSKYM